MKKKPQTEKRKPGRPRKAATPQPAEASVSASANIENAPAVPGIITEEEIIGKVESVKQTASELPPEHRTEIPPGTQVEETLIDLEQNPPPENEPGEAEEKKPEPPPPTGVGGKDVIAEMENNILLAPIEEAIGLKKDFLRIDEREQELLALVRPDDMEIKKSAEWYWGIFAALNVSKFLKWLVWNIRRKRELKAAVKSEKKKEPEIENVK